MLFDGKFYYYYACYCFYCPWLSYTCILFIFQNHWFTYNEKMSIESVTQAVSNLALQFGDDDAGPGAMVTIVFMCRYLTCSC